MSFYKNRYFFKTKDYTFEGLKQIFSNEKFAYLDIVVLFGSRAKNLNHTKSDYDFAVFCKTTNNPWGDMAQLWDDFSILLNLHECDYDIINLKDANKNIKNSIKEKYILLKGDEYELQRLLNINC